MFRRLLQPIYTAYAVVLFVSSVLFASPVFLLLSMTRSSAGRHAIFFIVKYWAGWWLWMTGMPLRKAGPQPPPGRYVIVANHISYLDVVAIFPAIRGYFRILGKKEMSRIPVFGMIYKQLVILVDRSSTASRAKSMRLLWRVVRHEGSIMIFPEGTFNETGSPLKSFYDGAFRLAISTGTPIFPMIFPDTVRRWHYSAWWKLWPGRNRVVYLEPVPVAGLTLADLPALKEKVYGAMEQALTRYSMGEGAVKAELPLC